MNAGGAVGDEPANVRENVRRLLASAGLAVEDLHGVSQVHGDVVTRSEGARLVEEADGLWTSRSGRVVGVKTADCVPVLLADPVGRRVAAVHSGWRGTLLEIARKAVFSLEEAGSRPGDLIAAIGPSIRPCCYQVSEELAARFSSHFGQEVAVRMNRGVTLDLVAAVRRSLSGAGVDEALIDVVPHCTACEEGRFFSHRRDSGRTGRHLNFIACCF